MDVYVVTVWNDATEEDYVAVFATRALAAVALKKVREKAGQLYGGVTKRRVIGG